MTEPFLEVARGRVREGFWRFPEHVRLNVSKSSRKVVILNISHEQKRLRKVRTLSSLRLSKSLYSFSTVSLQFLSSFSTARSQILYEIGDFGTK